MNTSVMSLMRHDHVTFVKIKCTKFHVSGPSFIRKISDEIFFMVYDISKQHDFLSLSMTTIMRFHHIIFVTVRLPKKKKHTFCRSSLKFNYFYWNFLYFFFFYHYRTVTNKILSTNNHEQNKTWIFIKCVLCPHKYFFFSWCILWVPTRIAVHVKMNVDNKYFVCQGMYKTFLKYFLIKWFIRKFY